jgi:hypothetical protein
MGQEPDQVTPEEQPAARYEPGPAAAQAMPEPQTVDEAKAQIEQTREEMTTTLDAIQAKLDPRRLRHDAGERAKHLATSTLDHARESTTGAVHYAVSATSEKAHELAERASATLNQVTQATSTVSEATQQASARAGDLAHQASQQAASMGITPDTLSERARTSIEGLRAQVQPPLRSWLEDTRRNPLPLALAGATLLSVLVAGWIGRTRGDHAEPSPDVDTVKIIGETPSAPIAPIV